MHLCLVVRHAAAEETAPSGLDRDRPLTDRADAELRRIAAGLAETMHPPDVLLSSPYPRARQTAEIIAAGFGGIAVESEPALGAGASAGDIMEALRAACRGSSGTIGIVGHEPDLGRFVSLALAASARSFFAFHKAGACLLEFPAVPRAGNATLEWALSPGHLEALALARAERTDTPA